MTENELENHFIPSTQVNNEHYSPLNYINVRKWMSYFHQIDLVRKHAKGNILEIGVGDSTVFSVLKKAGYSITGMDIDSTLSPDVLAGLPHIPFKDDSFDTILCCEVMEHCPWDIQSQIVKEFYRVASNKVIVSVPYYGLTFLMAMKLPLLKITEFRLRIPFPKERKFIGEHYWELGGMGTPRRKLRKIFKKENFLVEYEGGPLINNYHYFYLLSKR